MNDGEVISRLYVLTASELEGKALACSAPVAALESFSWIRVMRASSFWIPAGKQESAPTLQTATTDLVTGFSGPGHPWAFLVTGHLDHLECWYGAQLTGRYSDLFSSAFRSAFPDIRLHVGCPGMLTSFKEMSFQAVFTGVPSDKQKEGESFCHIDQIEKVCRALYGTCWAYLIVAEKAEPAMVLREINAMTLEIKNAYATFLLKENAADEHNKTAERYVELLESRLERWESGRSLGMWKYRGFLACKDPYQLSRGASVVRSAFSGQDNTQHPFRVHPASPDGLKEWQDSWVNSEELALLTRFPREEYSGFEIVPEVRFGVETNQKFREGDDLVKIGAILDRGQPVGKDLHIRRPDLTKHGIIVGVTGAGKTNTCFALLEQVWKRGKGVPFMVIESAKSEYRALMKDPAFAGLRVFTVGDETISPIRLNPFQVPRGILIQSHIDYLQALFGAAFVLYPPMPYVLAMSIQKVYEEKGWDLTRNTNTRGDDSPSCFPTLDDLIETVKRVSDGMGYEGEIRSNIKAALEGRLNQLRIGGGKGIMLNCRESLSDEDLFSFPCILELKQLVSDEEKAFLIGLLLIRLYEHYESKGHSGDGTLKHVTLIEEAHRLLKNVSTQQGGESANPQGKAIEVFANLLAEIRAFGEGIFMAEQIPTKLAPEALKNTNLKLIQRLVAKDDREAVGSTMNLSEEQMAAISTLRVGQAVTYLEGMEKAVLLQIPETETKKRYEQIAVAELKQRMEPFWKERKHLLHKHHACMDCPTGGRYCGGAELNQPRFVRSLRRIWMCLKYFPDLVEEEWRLFDHEVNHASNPYRKYSSTCIAIDWMSSFLNHRGQFFIHPITSIDALEGIIHQLILKLGNGFDHIADLECVHRELSGLGSIERSIRPFDGCNQCPTQCLFAHEVASSLTANDADGFREQFARQSPDAIDSAIKTSGEWLPVTDPKSAYGLACCHAISSIHRSTSGAFPDRNKFSAFVTHLKKTIYTSASS